MPKSRKTRKNCKYCGKVCKTPAAIYCSQQCQIDFQYQSYIEDWKLGLNEGNKVGGAGVSNHVRRYLLDKSNHSCSLCGWNKVNPTTGKIPLEIDHIDGNHLNNQESNLRVLCPNCHSLTPTYKGLNRGNGRANRK